MATHRFDPVSPAGGPRDGGAPRRALPLLVLAAVGALTLACGANGPSSLECVDLATESFGGAVIEFAALVEEGDQPAHCKVAGTIEGSIKFEVLLPEKDAWNGRFFMGGGGGFVGSVQNTAQQPSPGGTALERGYATSGTDTGHQAPGTDGSWALDNPEAEENFAHRAVHLTAVASKDIVARYYGSPSEYDYFIGCSRGGGQAMISSQRYPDDFDGIVAAAPAYSWAPFIAGFVQTQQAIFPDATNLEEGVITEANRALLEQSILAQCDAADGVEDGFLLDPRTCNFDPAALPRCAGDAAGEDCLTAAQLGAIQAVYGGPEVGGEQVFPGFPLGGENDPGGWDNWITGSDAIRPTGSPSLHMAFGTNFYKYLVYDDPEWDYTGYDFSTWKQDVAEADALYSADDTDLSAFRDAGGKMIFWHGWSDPAITALGTTQYYEQVEAGDPGVRDYARLFMLPGVLHCAGGPGPDQADWMGAIADWVEDGVAPDEIVTTKFAEGGEPLLSRPACPYPQVARWDGSGDPAQAASFVCADP